MRTAFTTAASMLGKASFNVFSACCCGLSGRGGFAGGFSVVLDGFAVDVDVADVSGASSSSISSGLTVVGDSRPDSVGLLSCIYV